MRRTLTILAITIVTILILGYLAHTFDIIGLIRATHGGGPASH